MHLFHLYGKYLEMFIVTRYQVSASEPSCPLACDIKHEPSCEFGAVCLFNILSAHSLSVDTVYLDFHCTVVQKWTHNTFNIAFWRF